MRAKRPLKSDPTGIPFRKKNNSRSSRIEPVRRPAFFMEFQARSTFRSERPEKIQTEGPNPALALQRRNPPKKGSTAAFTISIHPVENSVFHKKLGVVFCGRPAYNSVFGRLWPFSGSSPDPACFGLVAAIFPEESFWKIQTWIRYAPMEAGLFVCLHGLGRLGATDVQAHRKRFKTIPSGNPGEYTLWKLYLTMS